MVEDMSMTTSTRARAAAITATFTTISSTSTTTTAAPKRRSKYFPKQFESFYVLRATNLTKLF
jgi:hypothetical protein